MADLVGDAVAGAQHENGDVRILAAETSQDLRPAHPRQHQIENDQVVMVGSGQIQAAVSISRRVDGKAVGAQAARDETRNLGFVLYQENPHGQTFPKTAAFEMRGGE